MSWTFSLVICFPVRDMKIRQTHREVHVKTEVEIVVMLSETKEDLKIPEVWKRQGVILP